MAPRINRDAIFYNILTIVVGTAVFEIGCVLFVYIADMSSSTLITIKDPTNKIFQFFIFISVIVAGLGLYPSPKHLKCLATFIL